MKVLLTRRIPEKGIHLLEEAGCKLSIYAKPKTPSQQELIALAKENDALLSVGRNKLDAHFFEQCRHLKGIALMSVGYDHVDMESANKHRIPISNTPDVLSQSTSDVAFLLMLAVSRKAFYMHKTIEKGEWGVFDPTANLGIELYGKTLGIFGLGRIGVEMAKKAKAAYQMKIIYHNRNRNQEAENELGATYVAFEELLLQSDVISVHANLNKETSTLFDVEVFNQMKPSSIFINTARGGLHNEQDLIDALNNKQIWGAGLDVTNPEPMAVDNPLLTMPNVCVLPHIGSATEETRNEMATMAAKNIIAVKEGKQMPQQVII